MKKFLTDVKRISAVRDLHVFMTLPDALNPLITIIDHSALPQISQQPSQKIVLDLYNISVKRSFKGKLKYGKNAYDFDDGTMSFIAPNQIIAVDDEEDRNKDGWSLIFHPDLLRQYPLAKMIKNYGFFSYSVNEALHLSDEEDTIVESIIKNIKSEINSRLDNFSHDVLVSNIELLLSYCNRFYNRQFLSRKMATNDLLINFDKYLEQSFTSDTQVILPTVEQIADALNVSSHYLTDMLKNLTGQNTQQHIHEKIIERAKEKLTITNSTVSEIAFQLGFEYPQSFSKLFKSKTTLTPLEFRQQFN